MSNFTNAMDNLRSQVLNMIVTRPKMESAGRAKILDEFYDRCFDVEDVHRATVREAISEAKCRARTDAGKGGMR